MFGILGKPLEQVLNADPRLVPAAGDGRTKLWLMQLYHALMALKKLHSNRLVCGSFNLQNIFYAFGDNEAVSKLLLPNIASFCHESANLCPN